MTRSILALSGILLVFELFGASPCTAQTPGSMPGTPPFSATLKGPGDRIDPANLNVTIKVPVLSNVPGRGLPLSYNLIYNSAVWNVYGTSWQPATAWGWSTDNAAALGYETYWDTGEVPCYGYDEYYDWVQMGYTEYEGGLQYVDPQGVGHGSDWYVNIGVDWYADDNPVSDGCSGNYSNYGGGGIYDGSIYSGASPGGVSTRSGAGLTVPVNTTSGSGSIIDANGNEITSDGSSVTNTLGNVAVSYSSNPQYTAPSGATATYSIVTTSKSVMTNFGCSGISEYSGSAYLITEIDLPDHAVNSSDKYLFTYEATPGHSGYVTGRITSVTLPTGGTITYAYSGGYNGINCDGSTATLTRYTPDSGSSYWTYSHSLTAGTFISATTITDPQGNQTVMDFDNIYPMETAVYSGSSTSGTLLKTISSCYTARGSFSPYTVCPGSSTAIEAPFNKIATTTAWPGSGGLQSEVATSYSTYELPTEVDEYGYGSGAPGSLMRKTLTTYATLTGILDHPSEITVEDGSGNVKADTQYQYDQYSVLTTSGTPQFVASGGLGNLTTVKSLVSGSTYLMKTYTYYDTGNIYQATDVNGAVTTYNYSSSTASCGNSFPTSISEPLSLSKSFVWNCTGGVLTSMTDENGNSTSKSYTDAYFWRPASVTDQLSNTTNFSYTAMSSAENSLLFNGSGSTEDQLTTYDGLGRPELSQTKEGPSSSTYDSVETDYDSLGRSDRVTLPFGATAGTKSSSAPGTGITYDALNRRTAITDSGGLDVTFSYAQNDVLKTVGPAPSGENTKKKQYEYDAQGRLTSVCEVTSGTTGWPGGTCSQTSSQTGYWTKYTYDANNDLTAVTQNAQSSTAQTRSFTYDDLGRMTSEAEPESGTTNYVFDTDSTCGTSDGDLVKKTDAIGNVTCYGHDALHRMTSTTYPSGSYASVTPNRYFVYDAATVNSVTMSNAKTRLAEAYTCTSCPGTKLTDVGLSYDARGETTNAYESTPHSGSYYHVTESYWANGALSGLSGLGLPTMTYGVDSKGRSNTVSASSGQNPVTSVSYSVADRVTGITFGSSDSDSFTYDSNTNRMTQYSFDVGGSSMVGTLTWNDIGTLGQLAVTDPFYSGGNQTCVYSHDDLTRIAGVNCGSVWSQTFSFDPFGNINKSGSSNFSATYSASTNQMTVVGSSTPSYDSDGNVTNDFLHTYAWDSNGRPVTIDSVGATYNALGQMVEQNRSGSYTEIVYGTHGGKLALMNGSTIQKAYVPIPDGAMAVYNSSGLVYYRHTDWIGSSRVASTPSRAVYFDGAYAPYGESYAVVTSGIDLSFTGMDQDTVANLYDFPAREYGIQGRWPSPDPAGVASKHLQDPQTLNSYAYARNNPLALTDPTGEDECESDDVLDAGGDCGAYEGGDSGGSGGGDGGGDISGDDGGGTGAAENSDPGGDPAPVLAPPTETVDLCAVLDCSVSPTPPAPDLSQVDPCLSADQCLPLPNDADSPVPQPCSNCSGHGNLMQPVTDIDDAALDELGNLGRLDINIGEIYVGSVAYGICGAFAPQCGIGALIVPVAGELIVPSDDPFGPPPHIEQEPDVPSNMESPPPISGPPVGGAP